MRVGDLLEPELFKARLDEIVEEKNKLLELYYKSDEPSFSAEEIFTEFNAYLESPKTIHQ